MDPIPALQGLTISSDFNDSTDPYNGRLGLCVRNPHAPEYPGPTKKCRLHELFPTIAPKISRCRLLELPRELRDEIYGYALTYQEGLRVTKKMRLYPAKLELNAKGRGGVALVEANTLQYTCHQIHAETRVLTMRLNDTFTLKGSPGDDYGFRKFLRFAWQMKSTRCTPRRIHIHPDLTNAAHRLATPHLPTFEDYLYDDVDVIFTAPQQPLLRCFCLEHQNTTVILHLKLPLEPYSLLVNTYYELDNLMRHLRGQKLEAPVPENLRVVLEDAEDEDACGGGYVPGCRECWEVKIHRERAACVGHGSFCQGESCELCIGCDCKARMATLREQHKDGL